MGALNSNVPLSLECAVQRPVGLASVSRWILKNGPYTAHPKDRGTFEFHAPINKLYCADDFMLGTNYILLWTDFALKTKKKYVLPYFLDVLKFYFCLLAIVNQLTHQQNVYLYLLYKEAKLNKPAESDQHSAVKI